MLKFLDTFEKPILITASHQIKKTSSLEIVEYKFGDTAVRETICARLVGDHDSGAAGKKFAGPCTSRAAIVKIPPMQR